MQMHNSFKTFFRTKLFSPNLKGNEFMGAIVTKVYSCGLVFTWSFLLPLDGCSIGTKHVRAFICWKVLLMAKVVRMHCLCTTMWNGVPSSEQVRFYNNKCHYNQYVHYCISVNLILANTVFKPLFHDTDSSLPSKLYQLWKLLPFLYISTD